MSTTQQLFIVIVISLLATIGCGQTDKSVTTPKNEADNKDAAKKENHNSSSTQSKENANAGKIKVMSSGIHQQTITLANGKTQRFTISVPTEYQAKSPCPLIVALHYGGRVTPFYGGGMVRLLAAPLGELNAIIVAPDALEPGWQNATNENAVLELMDLITASYSIDSSKTILTGYSMGGHGCWYIGGRNQNRFSAVIPVAGRAGGDYEWKIPLYVIHSKIDKVVPFEPTQKHVRRLKEKGANVTFKIVEDITHYDTGRFQVPLRAAVPWIQGVWK